MRAARLAMVSAAGLAVSFAAAAPPPGASDLGRPYPGAVVTLQAPGTACSRRYSFKSHADLADLAEYNLAEGQAAGLMVIGDYSRDSGKLRTIAMGRKGGATMKGGGGVLFAQMSAEPDGVRGAVYARRPGCDQPA